MNPRLFPTSAAALGLLRSWIFGLWTAHVALDPLTDLAALPPALFDPPGLLALLPEGWWSLGLSAGGLLGLKAALLLSLGATTLGVLGRSIPLVASGLLVYYQGLVRGFGHINHSEFPLLYAAFLLALFPCADAWALNRKHSAAAADGPRYAAPVLLVMIALCFSYFFVGANRIVHGWDVFGTPSMSFWMILGAYSDTGAEPGLGRFILEHKALGYMAQAGFIGVTALELLAPLCILSRRFRAVFCLLMGSFHVMAYLTMNVLFWSHVALYVAFLDLDRLARRLSRTARGGDSA